MLKRLLLAAALLLTAPIAYAQTTFPTAGSATGGPSAIGGVGMYVNNQGIAVPETNSDPCANPSNTKASVPISVTSATTTQLVAAVAGQAVYLCGGTFTIAPSATSADTALFEYGSGTNCGTGTTALTGSFGAGDLTTAAPPTVVPLFSSGVVMVAPAGKALCMVSAGTTVNIQGVLSVIQQ
jgi:hypothetical protein